MKLVPKFNLGVQSLALLFFMVVNARDLEISKKSEFMKIDYVNFNYNDLKVGAKMPVYFGCALKGEIPQFLPKEIADKIPLSSQKLPFLLNYFGFHAESPQAKAMNYSLKTCETNVKGGAKKCVTSLESMIEFVRKSFKTSTTTKNKLVDDLKVLSTSPLPKSAKRFQTYTIVDQPKRVASPNIMACHAMTYPYAMYFCHYPEPENRVYEFSIGDTKAAASVQAIQADLGEHAAHETNAAHSSHSQQVLTALTQFLIQCVAHLEVTSANT